MTRTYLGWQQCDFLDVEFLACGPSEEWWCYFLHNENYPRYNEEVPKNWTMEDEEHPEDQVEQVREIENLEQHA